jgi:hypothetical protein
MERLPAENKKGSKYGGYAILRGGIVSKTKEEYLEARSNIRKFLCLIGRHEITTSIWYNEFLNFYPPREPFFTKVNECKYCFKHFSPQIKIGFDEVVIIKDEFKKLK